MTQPLPAPILLPLLAVGSWVHAYSKRWTPRGWEPVDELATVLSRIFVDRASIEPVIGTDARG